MIYIVVQSFKNIVHLKKIEVLEKINLPTNIEAMPVSIISILYVTPHISVGPF